MSTHYAEVEDIERALGVEIKTNTRPSIHDAEGILERVDGLINGRFENDTGTNFTDSTGDIKRIAIEKAVQMVNNMFAFSDPANFAFIPIELSKEEIRDIHKSTRLWSGETFDLGE